MPKLDEVNMAEMNPTLQRASTTMTALLAAIASISLVAGGAGIMNSMLVAGSRRPREIGSRRAGGPRRRDVLPPLLGGALALSAVGALTGFSGGGGPACWLTLPFKWPTRVSPSRGGSPFGSASGGG